MAGSIREAMNSAIDRRALAPAALAFELDHVGAVESFVVPFAPVAGQLADAITTQMALRKEGLTEGNPLAAKLVGNAPLWYAVKIGVGAFSALTIKRLQQAGHKKGARIASVVATLAGAGPAISNLRTMGKL